MNHPPAVHAINMLHGDIWLPIDGVCIDENKHLLPHNIFAIVLSRNLIYKSTSDLAHTPDLNLKSIAVWRIEAQSPTIDVENVRQKIITNLVKTAIDKLLQAKPELHGITASY